MSKSFIYQIAFLLLSLGLFSGCGSPLSKLAKGQVKNQDKLVGDKKLASMGDVVLSKENLSFYNMDGRVYNLKDMETMPAALREEVFRRELLRRAFVRKGIKEGIYNNAEAEAYVWPRLEKILEEYYHYKKLNYPSILAKNQLRFSGNKAIESFYEKNRQVFAKDKLSIDDVKLQISRKIQALTEKEYEQKKLAAIQEVLKTEKVEIPRVPRK